MEIPLQSALRAYLAEASAHVESRIMSSPSPKVRRLKAVGGNDVIRGWFAECETLESWRLLVLAWDGLLLECDWMFDRKRGALRPAGLLGTWLRRRGAYAEIAARKIPSAAQFTERLIEDTQHVARERQLVRMLAVSPFYPWDSEENRWGSGPGFETGLSFPKGRFDLGGFELWSQSDSHDLKRLFECSSNKLFFPNSVTSVEDIAGPSGTPLWLALCAAPIDGMRYSRWRKSVARGNPLAERKTGPQPIDGGFDLVDLIGSAARRSYAHESGWIPFEPWVQEIFSKLLLWRWLTCGPPSVETTIVMDFALEWPTDPFERPPNASLATGVATHTATFHPGCACDEECQNSVCFSEPAASDFKEFMVELSRSLGRISEIPKWRRWIDTALLFMTKSAIAEHEVDNFLWSIVALESLLEKDDDKDKLGITQAIAKRLVRLCGPDVTIDESELLGSNQKHRNTTSVFKEAYNSRSKVVHGDKLDAEFYRLTKMTFALARSAAARLIHLLCGLAEESTSRLEAPKRERILEALDGTQGPLSAKIESVLQKPLRWQV
jgi:hypothetical protein